MIQKSGFLDSILFIEPNKIRRIDFFNNILSERAIVIDGKVGESGQSGFEAEIGLAAIIRMLQNFASIVEGIRRKTRSNWG